MIYSEARVAENAKSGVFSLRATEVVLQRYRGELTMLDARNETGGASDFSNPSEIDNSSSPAPEVGNSTSAELDDEIPF